LPTDRIERRRFRHSKERAPVHIEGLANSAKRLSHFVVNRIRRKVDEPGGEIGDDSLEFELPLECHGRVRRGAPAGIDQHGEGEGRGADGDSGCTHVNCDFGLVTPATDKTMRTAIRRGCEARKVLSRFALAIGSEWEDGPNLLTYELVARKAELPLDLVVDEDDTSR
jgi:hypothetical protein